MEPGINVQLNVLTMADVPDLRRFTGGALVIVDWPEHVPDTLAVLDAAGVSVGMFRFTENPSTWLGWPAAYLARSPWAVLANEPDIEGKHPSWYGNAVEAWAYAGGKVIEPAWSDEEARYNDGVFYRAVSAHVYPLGRGAANLAAVRARAGIRPVIITEAGVEHDQPTILQRLAALGAGDLPVYVYSYRAKDAQAMPGYDVAGVALLPVATPAQNPSQPLQNESGDTKGLQVLDWPIINQLTQPDNNDASDCGPATADMIARYLGLVPADEAVRQVKLEETGNGDYTGYTTTVQMQAWFASRGVPCVQVQTQDPGSAIADALANGWPVAYLRYGDVTAKTGGHFVAAVPGQPTFTFANPWNGGYDLWTAADVNANSLGGWLVIVQQAKEQPTVDDTLKAAAVARFSALGVQPNTAGALFAAYARMVDRWIKSGRDALADPTPPIKPEVNTGQDAYLPLDSGVILHWRASDGLTYQAEDKERAAIFKGCGWAA